jgi:hypothetical protein
MNTGKHLAHISYKHAMVLPSQLLAYCVVSRFEAVLVLVAQTSVCVLFRSRKNHNYTG